ncbi:polysaccharide deacetylase family protein [Fervidobacterium sp.]
MKHKGHFVFIAAIFLFIIGVGTLTTYTILRMSETKRIEKQLNTTFDDKTPEQNENQEQSLGILLEQMETKSSTESTESTESSESSVENSNDEDMTLYQAHIGDEITQQGSLESSTPSILSDNNQSIKFELGKLYTKLPTEENVVLLTIDDGPGNYTGEILDFLKEHNIKAIFFVSGDTVKGYPDILKRQYEEGHEIGTHTFCHRSFYKLQKTATIEEMREILISDLDKTESNIKEILPEVKIRFLRMPEGYYRDWVGEIAQKYGYITMNWSVAGDWLNEPDEKIIEMFKSSIRPGTIILLHDGRNRGKRALKILKELVPYILSKGYTFADPKKLF